MKSDRVAIASRVEHLPPVDPGQTEVGYQHIEREISQALQRVLPAVGLLDREAVIRQPLRDRFTERLLVVNDQQMCPAVRHLLRRTVF
jgi:hypothetical protein